MRISLGKPAISSCHVCTSNCLRSVSSLHAEISKSGMMSVWIYCKGLHKWRAIQKKSTKHKSLRFSEFNGTLEKTQNSSGPSVASKLEIYQTMPPDPPEYCICLWTTSYPWTPKPWKMKVLNPKIWAITRKKWRWWVPMVIIIPLLSLIPSGHLEKTLKFEIPAVPSRLCSPGIGRRMERAGWRVIQI